MDDVSREWRGSLKHGCARGCAVPRVRGGHARRWRVLGAWRSTSCSAYGGTCGECGMVEDIGPACLIWAFVHLLRHEVERRWSTVHPKHKLLKTWTPWAMEAQLHERRRARGCRAVPDLLITCDLSSSTRLPHTSYTYRLGETRIHVSPLHL